MICDICGSKSLMGGKLGYNCLSCNERMSLCYNCLSKSMLVRDYPNTIKNKELFEDYRSICSICARAITIDDIIKNYQ